MRRTSVIFVVTALVGGLLWVMPAQASTEKSGVIDSEVWIESESPYKITGPLIINDLRVEENTEIVVQGDFPITVAGSLEVNGEPGEPVTFTYKAETTGGWQGIRFAESQEGSDITGAIVSYADTGLATNRRAWSVEDSYFHDNTTGAEIKGALGETPTGQFEHNYVEENGTGVKVAGQVATFALNSIVDNTTGIEFSTVEGTYSDNNIVDNATAATTCVQPGMGEVDATENWWGTIDEDDIEDMICDGTEGAELASPTVDFDDFEAAPVPGAATAAPFEPGPSASPSATFSPGPAPQEHSRTVSLNLRGHLKVGGAVFVSDGFTACLPTRVAIKFQPSGGRWKVIKRVPVDASNGTYSAPVRDRRGSYQARIGRTATTSYICLAAASAKVRHSHR